MPRTDGQTLRSILTLATERNRARNITGFLYFRDGRFMQLLEGDREKVIACYNKIKKDSRHYNVKKFAEFEDESRLAPNWSMNLIKDNSESRQADEVLALIESSRGDQVMDDAESVSTAFRFFLKDKTPVPIDQIS